MSRSFLVPILLPADPTAPLEAATKQYVDAKPSGGGFTFSQDTAPTATAEDQTWFNTATGQSFVWINDGTSSQWVQFAPGAGGGSGKPRGLVAYSQVTTNFTTTSTSPVDAGMSVTWTADPTRTYRTSIYFLCSSSVNNDDIGVNLTDGSGNRKQFFATPYLDPNSSVSISGAAIESGLSGSTTRKVMVYRAQGSGTVQIAGDPTYPRFIMVEDITYEVGGGAGGSSDMAQPAAKVYKVNALSVLNNTATLPVWDNDEFDTHDLWQPGTPNRFTIPFLYPGTYMLTFTGLFSANANGARTAWFRVNGDATHRIGQVQVQPVGTGGTAYAATATLRLNSGDYVEVVIQQDSGAALNLNGGATARVSPSTFSITRIGA